MDLPFLAGAGADVEALPSGQRAVLGPGLGRTDGMVEVSVQPAPGRSQHGGFQVKLAVLLAAEARPRERGLGDRLPAALLPLVDRPFIQHVVEHLVDCGITEIHVVLSHLPEKVEALLGDGQRWGIRIRYSLAPSEEPTSM